MLRQSQKVGLSQVVAAAQIGIDPATLLSWEQGKRLPSERFYPAIIQYLGVEPWPEPSTLAERLRGERLRRGLSCEQVANLMQVDRSSISKWEGGVSPKHSLARAKLEAFLSGRPRPSMRGRKTARLAGQ